MPATSSASCARAKLGSVPARMTSQKATTASAVAALESRNDTSSARSTAVAMQDRFQRQFLRLMKCYRDGRRLIGSMTVPGGRSTSLRNRS
jgi:hypothetical protein